MACYAKEDGRVVARRWGELLAMVLKIWGAPVMGYGYQHTAAAVVANSAVLSAMAGDQRHLAEALPWLWALTLRDEPIGSVARLALGRLFAAEIEMNSGKTAVAGFLVHKIRPLLNPETATCERQAALSAVNSALNAASAESATPAVARLIQAQQPDLAPVSELWAAALNSVPHRRMAVIALHLTLAALTDTAEAVDAAVRLGKAILPRLTARTREVLELTLPDPQRTEAISAPVIRAFLGAQQRRPGDVALVRVPTAASGRPCCPIVKAHGHAKITS